MWPTFFVLANEWICKLKYFHCTETKSYFCTVQESPANYLFINSDLFYMIFFHSIYVQIAFWSHHLCLPKDSFDRCFVYRFLLIYFYVLSFVHVCLLKWPSYVVFQLINFVGVCVYKICPHKLIHFKKEKKNTLYDDLAFSLIWN